MKKLLVWMLCVVMLASLTACGDTAPDDNNSTAQGETGGNAGTPAVTQKPAGNEASPKPAETDTTPEPAGADDGSQGTSAEENSIDDFVSGITLIQVPELGFTFWDYTGAYENGKELSAEEAAAFKIENNHVVDFLFPDSTAAAILEQNGNMKYGEYSIREDGYALDITLDDNGTKLLYTAMFKKVDDVPVMMLFFDKSAKTVWYFTLFTDMG